LPQRVNGFFCCFRRPGGAGTRLPNHRRSLSSIPPQPFRRPSGARNPPPKSPKVPSPRFPRKPSNTSGEPEPASQVTAGPISSVYPQAPIRHRARPGTRL
ncbi:hypothetical protein, partial [Desulfoluna sp.]|uniref:hypothetical protein n=1 Tax=Desulfoluna sp. TaxID=2045199 RepID=UPI00262AD297